VETYSLLQPELGATIDRRALEEASVAAPGVGKADCARIARELFGIIVSGLTIEDATAFRAALAAKNFPAWIVADRELPRLPDGRFFTRLDTTDEVLTFSDTLGRVETCRADDVLLLAAGFLQHQKNTSERALRWQIRKVRYVAVEQIPTVKDFLEFRFECFIKRKPYRLRLNLDASANFLWNGLLMRLSKPDAIHAFMKIWHRLAPRAPWNLGLINSGTDFEYPSLRAFENEIRWRFYSLKQQAANPQRLIPLP
jgi:hypothetical protein